MINAKKGLNIFKKWCSLIAKSCLSGSMVIFYFGHRSQPEVMKISPFRTIYTNDLKSLPSGRDS